MPGADGYSIPSIVCDIYFEGTFPCFGGLLALEGLTGKELWRHYSDHEMYGINCEADLNSDGVKDCLAGGRAGVSHFLYRFCMKDSEIFARVLFSRMALKDTLVMRKIRD